MLIINGVLVEIDDRILVNAFGYSYERDERLGRWIAEMIEDRLVEYRYNSINQMRAAFFGANAHNHLVIQFAHPDYRAVTIIMTGRRDRDEEEANRLSRLRFTPDNYTWHHCENIRRVGNGYECRMILIQSWYHQQPHAGGVNEYELLTNTRYN